jgi:hypothetical protein
MSNVPFSFTQSQAHAADFGGAARQVRTEFRSR